MKKGILVVGLFVLTGTVYAQMPSVKVPRKTGVQTQTEVGTEAIYKKLIGKDVAAAMKAFNMKDSIGKSSYAFIPQIEKGTKFLLLALPNGDKIAYKDNILAGIVYKQNH